jgi:hypothetical protein
MAVAGMLLLPVGYVGSYGSESWLHGRGIIGIGLDVKLQQTVFAPLHWYERHDFYANRTIHCFGRWCYFRGAGKPIPWNDFNWRP